jgi:hypothetical protein
MSILRNTHGPPPLFYRDRLTQQDLILEFSGDGKLSTINTGGIQYSPQSGIMIIENLASFMNESYNVIININNELRMEASLRSSYDNVESISIHPDHFEISFKSRQRFLDQDNVVAVGITNTHHNQDMVRNELMTRVINTRSLDLWPKAPLRFNDTIDDERFVRLYFLHGRLSRITTNFTDNMPPQRAYVSIIRNPEVPGYTHNAYKTSINVNDTRMKNEFRLCNNSVRRVYVERDSFHIIFRCPRTFLGLQNVLDVEFHINATHESDKEGQLMRSRLGQNFRQGM